MKKTIILSITLFIFISVANSFASPAVWLDISYGKDEGDKIADNYFSLQPNESFWTNIYISDVTESIFTMGFNLNYQSSQLDILTSEIGSTWPQFQEVDYENGEIKFGAATETGNFVIGDNILLASVEFKCLNAGLSEIILTKTDVAGNGFYINESGTAYDISDTITFPTASINQTPIPGAAWLLGAGLVGLLGIGRKRYKK
ncbi:cohesin domain-containing protein [Desulfobacter latus]|uniref:Cohesin domain-containing protein n=1 Tax=Desulfobacter latus TaxID=2292 RepID=A0A850SSX6_9BACT|nr:cohesin domain-containing protein [Desulfobacter latus]NWH04494.1 hypothetical protein [Desulfobacter latus]